MNIATTAGWALWTLSLESASPLATHTVHAGPIVEVVWPVLPRHLALLITQQLSREKRHATSSPE